MITGDNPLTACHVANTLKMNEKQLLVLMKEDSESENSGNQSIKYFNESREGILPDWSRL